MTAARLLSVAAAVAAMLVAGCGSRSDPVRVGLLTNCGTLWEPFSEPMVAASQLALLARGARSASERPSAGVSEAVVAGRPVELIAGCSDGSPADTVAQARRLVEERGAAVLVGGFTVPEGTALREYARRRPRVTFVIVANAQATTLREPAPNVFRFSTDAAQWMAGLGSYAYRELGWRTAAFVGDAGSFGYAQAAGFAAEFCALGGRVLARIFPPAETPDLTPFAARVPAAADGVVVSGLVTAGFLQSYRPTGRLARRVLVGGGGAADADIAQALGRRARGIVSAGPLPADLATPEWRAYAARAQREFPRRPLVTHVFVVPYHVAMEAVVRALGAAGADLSGGQRRFRRALATTVMNAPYGRLRLDSNRQAIAPNYLMRIGTDGAAPHTTIRKLDAVEQSFGGRFRVGGPVASRTQPACARADPPPWAVG
jgi:branched-chain amino acid transport system substrate-binding protein